jgi:glycosyltransferase involved in cell wall biosynthesis
MIDQCTATVRCSDADATVAAIRTSYIGESSLLRRVDLLPVLGVDLKPQVTFVIPSLDRRSLLRTLRSLQAQSDRRWNAIVLFDGLQHESCSSLFDDKRIEFCHLTDRRRGSVTKQHGTAGSVRNVALEKIEQSGSDAGEWVAFVDDDDYVAPHYVERLLQLAAEQCTVDLFLFRALLEHGESILIKPAKQMVETQSIAQNEAPISFAVRRSACRQHQLRFEQHNSEEFDFLNRAKDVVRHRLVNEVLYFAPAKQSAGDQREQCQAKGKTAQRTQRHNNAEQGAKRNNRSRHQRLERVSRYHGRKR